jgi:hypothetical protein
MTRSCPVDALAAFALIFALVSCKGEERVCVPGSTQTCACPGTDQGAQACAADGFRWELCVCAPPDPAALRRKKISECNALTSVTNNGARTLLDVSKTWTEKPGVSDAVRAMKTTSVTLDKAAQEAAQVKLTIPELQKLSADYQAMAKEIGNAATELAAALETSDFEKVDAGQAALALAAGKEDAIINNINRFCQAP